MKFKIIIFTALIIFLLGFLLYQFITYRDNKLHIVFCDVGQGDAIFIRTPGGSDILFDGGPNEKVMDCLSEHMPLWDRKIDLVILSHPHADHLEGLIPVLENYSVGTFATEEIRNNTEGYKELQQLIKDKQIPVKILYKGDLFTIDKTIRLSILGPTRQLLQETSPDGIVGQSKEFGNVVLLLTYGDFKAILTGDSQAPNLLPAVVGLAQNIDILQVPHHGSATGLSEEVLKTLTPKLGVISVGKNNRYHHPAFTTLVELEKQHIPIKRTDENGEIEIITGGINWKLYR